MREAGVALDAIGFGMMDRAPAGARRGGRRLQAGAQHLPEPRRAPGPDGGDRPGPGLAGVRIVAGEFGGRRLVMPKDARVRPTSDRVREAWMSILGAALPGRAGARPVRRQRGARARGALPRGAAAPSSWNSGPPRSRRCAANIEALGVDGAVRGPPGRRDAVRRGARSRAPSTSRSPTRPTTTTRPPGWSRSSAGRPLPAFFRWSTAPPWRCPATTPAATATPPSPSATRHDSHRDLPRLVRSADARARGPHPPEPAPVGPAHRRGGGQRLQAAALRRRGAAGHAADRRRPGPADRVRVVRGAARRLRAPGGRVGGGARAPRGERLRVRVPDGADEPAAASRRWRRSSSSPRWT